MKEDFQVEKEISIVEIFKALFSKIVYLILALILGACAGGAYGYLTSKDVVIYGTSIEYYVNPVPKDIPEGDSTFANYGSYSSSAMNNIVRSLESERFSSILLDDLMGINDDGTPAINKGSIMYDENGGYMRDTDGNLMYDGIVYTEETKEVDVYSYAVKKDNSGNVVYNAGFSVDNIGDSLTDSTGAYMYDNKGNVMVEGIVYVKEVSRKIITLYTVKVVDGDVVYKDGFSGEERTPAIAGLPLAKYNSEGKLTSEYKNWINKISSAVKFSYKTEGNIAESSIYVSLSMNGDDNAKTGKATIEAICSTVLSIVPDFVSKNMQLPQSYKETKCETLTLNTDIKPINGSYASSQMTKLAVIAGVIALVIAAAIVITLHMSDKRLRDVEVLPKAFNLPLLGVIPTIDEAALKQKEEDKGGKA